MDAQETSDLSNILEEDTGVNEINIAPLVDVCLVLVLIFMVTAPFIAKPLIPVTLPQAVTSKTEDQKNITISVSPKDGFSINEIPIAKQALAHELDRQMDKAGIAYVLIRADERVPHGDVEDVMKICRQLGARRIAFATVPKSQ